ncbi:SDR family NAD(P)-dependent oxidoreductase [Novosphingobium sp. JCM 18896]|uniref:SDR family NAD(P)-dependent oxidoreductase n=1 Tax=Novosphingobium sp. JCM 18896 TaxID=2989731 RepID=UPI0022232100|nr:SDR family NAD(P)-dependent oxidoreductase [Novosphingobium sp. JCM 18896]MCW1431645.1 SDR family NAD(P)-dependent oxidoreductase [Novosphingobium sp. JCM 18896]
MTGDAKTAVVTGASSGVGLAGAIELARLGWNVIALGRNPERSAEALTTIRGAATSGAKIEMIVGDLDLLAGTARMADGILSTTGKIDALINNAGGVRNRREITPEGNEATFAGNYLGHFLLTKRLLPALRLGAQSGKARIVNVSSEGHRQAPEFDWADLQGTNNWVSGRNYCLAKLCNLLFTFELARRLEADGIVAHGMHPGEAATNFSSYAVPEMQAYIASLETISPHVAGRTIAWLTASDEAACTTGGYYFDRELVTPAPSASNASDAARLWTESQALLARAGY